MAFKFPVQDWWTARDWCLVLSPDAQCAVCHTTRGIAMDDTTDEAYPLCELHSHCTPNAVRTIIGLRNTNAKLSMQEFEASRWNSYDRDALIPFYSDEVLVWNTEYALRNVPSFESHASTYNEALQLYAKELTKRLIPNRIVRVESIDEISL